MEKSVVNHLLLMAAMTVAIGLLYGTVWRAYFCADDDFIELHRAAFEDSADPARVLTTSHLGSYKYRPFNHALTLVTYWIGQGNPQVFRIRNIVFHLINVGLVYALAWVLLRDMAIASMAAALFGVHPLTNQTINGAVWTNVIAHTAFLAAFVLFLVALRATRWWWQLLLLSLVIGWLGLLTYDPALVIFGLILVCLGIEVMTARGPTVRWGFIAGCLGGLALLLGVYGILRLLFVPDGWGQSAAHVPGVSVIVRNLGMYTVALLLPVDAVLAHAWFATPLPSAMATYAPTGMAILLGACGTVGMAAWPVWLWRKALVAMLQTTPWTVLVLLLGGILLTLVPVLALSSHPSETYLYMPVAFFAVLVAWALTTLGAGARTPQGRACMLLTYGILLGLCCAATWTRNAQVVRCGATAARILASLPAAQLSAGAWTVAFANRGGEDTSQPYGLYALRGIETIAAVRRANSAVTAALQLTYHNALLTGEVVPVEALSATCTAGRSSRHLCLWVQADGHLEPGP